MLSAKITEEVVDVRRAISTDAPAGILVIAMLVFGPKKLGELGKGLGEGIRSFKQAVRDDKPTSESRAVDEGTKQTK